MPKYLPFEAFGFKTVAPRWALSIFALVLFIASTWFVYQKVYADPEQQLISLQDANKQLAAEIEEYGRHAMEEPQKHELFEEQDGKLALRVFKDHCVLIQRQTLIQGVRTKLVVDLARATSLVASRQITPPIDAFSLFPTLEAAEQDPCRRGCQNPHPGDFKWWYGERRGDWVQVWRRWPEGCQHYQMFHPRSGTWDSNPDGTPKVFWTCCVH